MIPSKMGIVREREGEGMKKMFVRKIMVSALALVLVLTACTAEAESMVVEKSLDLTYPIVDTNQKGFYGDSGEISEPTQGDAFYGQDANYSTNLASYTDHGDGTVTDNVTGLMWQQDAGIKMSYDQALSAIENSNLAGYSDWRMPTIKELYSLIDFNGVTGMDASSHVPYLNEDYFTTYVGNETNGERFIDAQYMSSTKYVSTTMNGDETVFGVNFVDGRIKGYGVKNPKTKEANTFYTLMVRGNVDYGKNNFVDNGDGTITDLATGLMWLQEDSKEAMLWQDALAYGEAFTFAGYSDWKVPDAKELQSIVDYSRSLATSNSAAIDPMFSSSIIVDEGGHINYPFYWSSTTHLDGKSLGSAAVYIAFGEALGFMPSPFNQDVSLLDVHGAGAQRSDPKLGSASDYPVGFGPQGDVRRIENHVRLVRVVDSVSYDFSKTGVLMLGTGGPSISDERSGPSTLFFHNDTFFLVDMGEGTQQQLEKAGISTGDIKTLMFTHHHLDHNEEYIPILINGWLRGRNELELIGTEGTSKLHNFVTEFYEEDMEYRARSKVNWTWKGIKSNVAITEDGSERSIDGVNITSSPVNHSIATQAYRFDVKGLSVVITGDLSYTPSLATFAYEADLMVIDSGNMKASASLGDGTESHGNLKDVATMANDARVKTLVLTHLSDGFDREFVLSFIGKHYDGDVIIANDLDYFTVTN